MEERLKGKSFSAWLGENIVDISIILICVAYVAVGLLKVVETGKTPLEIIFDGAKSLVTGLLIGRLMKMKGMSNGEKTEAVLRTKTAYGDIIDKITPRLNRLQEFCEKYNADRLRLLQTRALMKAGIAYEEWIGGQYVPKTREQKHACRKASKVKIKFIDKQFLLCDADDERGNGFGRNKREYMGATDASDVFSKLVIAVIIGMYSVEMIKGVTIASVIWECFQVLLFVGFGAVKYLTSYMYVNDEYRTLLIQKTNILYEFDISICENIAKTSLQTPENELELTAKGV